ncbi:MAG TPA: hypothetical protein VJ859_16580 [Allosphingosinicella sp.]|nr:hypothetical protein [Allosphingosinicella sp.]
MRHLLATLTAVTLALSPVAASAAAADPDAPSYAKGTVWDFAMIRTQDGHFDDYMQWLAGRWQEQQEALKKAGYIRSYKVLIVSDPRPNEADLILATEYQNMAAFDRTADEEYAMQKKIFGSLATASKEQAARGSIRTVLGDMLLREAVLK